MISKIEQKLDSKNYEKVIVTPRFCYFKSKKGNQLDIGIEILESLSRKKRFIHPKFFYDKRGSELFEQICLLPEYYLTKTELEILDTVASELSRFLIGNYVLIELGSGSSIKSQRLLETLSTTQNQLEYCPIDISDILKDSSNRLHDKFHNLKITGIIDQYEQGLEFLKKIVDQKKIIAFLGSSLGNFEPENAVEFLAKIHSSMGKNDLLLLGLDLVKDTKILEKAYNDSKGITAKFNLNLLSRLNVELGANFDKDKFAHIATFNTAANRIEMYLQSQITQDVHISRINLLLKFKKGELINTEYSYKYTISQIVEMTQKIGFRLLKVWTDKQSHFALVLLSTLEKEQ